MKIKYNTMKIGNKLKSLRVKKGYTPDFVVDKLEISLVTYRRMERDVSIPDINLIEKIANTFDIPIADILTDDKIILSQNQTGGTSNNALIINQLSEKLIEQYELRIKEKDIIINELRKELQRR